MNLIQNYLTESGCYKAGKHITVKGLMIHSVGCPQPKADVFMKNWNRAEASAYVHAIVEPDGDVYQLLPWDFRGWHCRGGANNTHIGVEMTVLGCGIAGVEQSEVLRDKEVIEEQLKKSGADMRRSSI